MRSLILLLLFPILIFGQSDTTRIKDDLWSICNTPKPRNYQNLKSLNKVANYIKFEFERCSFNVTEQQYQVQNNSYRNIIASFGPQNAPRIIIGAHYDAHGNQQGADDNATGVVGLLELARMLEHKNDELKHRIDLVAYTLEEPPFFRSEYMGSYIHAKHLADNNIPTIGMISLEMIGYFSDAKKSQDYPAEFLKLFYGNTGDYITVVKKFGSGKFARQFNRKFRKTNLGKTKTFKGPRWLPGIDFSDHLNYWNLGFSAIMITDTAFYRNKNYHTKEDTIDKLNLSKMAEVIEGVYNTLLLL